MARVADVEAEAINDLREALDRVLREIRRDNRVDPEEAGLLAQRMAEAFDEVSGRVLGEVARELEEFGFPTDATPATVQAVQQQRANVRRDLDRLGREAAAEIASGKVGAFDRLDKLAADALTLVDTGSLAVDRAVSLAQAEATGITNWLYDGPKDGRNREDCRKWVGKRFTTEQIAALESQVGPQPVALYQGGWNCRHRWSPLDETELRDYPPWRG